jgi:GntR family transcriptional regulator
MDRINRNSKLPLYHQLYEILRSNITRGEWQPGDMIPPESELIDRYQVSRTTVRQVLDMLVNEGLIYRQRGRGTFVAHPTVEQALVRIISFTEDMRQRGFKPGEELARLERLRLADDEPMSIEDSYLVSRVPCSVTQYATRDTYEGAHYGHRLSRRAVG